LTFYHEGPAAPRQTIRFSREIGKSEPPINDGFDVFSPIMPHMHHSGINVDLKDEFTESQAMRWVPFFLAQSASVSPPPFIPSSAWTPPHV
jgi:hypothetical protein